MKTMMTTAALAAALCATPFAAFAEDKTPMPTTRGMQGMDPAAHDRWAAEGKQDPHKDCKPNVEKAAQAKKHPMPETRGMKGMDPKSHEMDCPEPAITEEDPSKVPKHVHKGPNG